MGLENTETNTGLAGTIAVVFARVLVPLWLATGAILKLVDLSPAHLPAALIKWCGELGIDLLFVLRFSIASELIIAGVMVLLPPLARWVGVATLTIFVPVLIGDLVMGASTCGCFGAIEVSPWITLVTDLTFLFGILILGRGEPRLRLTSDLPTTRVIAAGLWSLSSVAVAFGVPVSAPSAAGNRTIDPPALASSGDPKLPSDGYYLPQYDDWIGRSFRQLEIASWIRDLPDNIDVASHYIIFYRKDCEHCHELMEVFFSGSLRVPTTAIAVPERDGFPTENVQPFACSECQMAELPAGIDWFLQTPVLVRLADGVVECAAEVDASTPKCIDW